MKAGDFVRVAGNHRPYGEIVHVAKRGAYVRPHYSTVLEWHVSIDDLEPDNERNLLASYPRFADRFHARWVTL